MVNIVSNSHTKRRLPPLGALTAFEAAARHQSFSRAAEELHLTEFIDLSFNLGRVRKIIYVTGRKVDRMVLSVKSSLFI